MDLTKFTLPGFVSRAILNETATDEEDADFLDPKSSKLVGENELREMISEFLIE